MPSLVFARRRLLLGGDEFMVPYATFACGRTVWVLFLCVGLALTVRMLFITNCVKTGYVMFGYEAASIVVGAISLVVEFQIANASTYGTIIDPGPRNELLEKYLTRKSVLGAMQLVLALAGVMLVVFIPIFFPCQSMAVVVFGILLTAISQFLDAGGMYCCFLAFASRDDRIQDEEEEGQILPHSVLAKMELRYEDFCRKLCRWAAWCSGWCSCTFSSLGGADGAQQADFAHVSRVFSRMLSANQFVDVVPTDIAAGLILVRHLQKSEDYKRRGELKCGSDTAPSSTVSKDPGIDEIHESQSRNTNYGTASEVGLVNDFRVSGEYTSGGARLPADSETILSPGSVPLRERPRKHRMYYKVTPNERLLDLDRRGEDWRVLEEMAHFVRYVNVMYSVWATIAVDPEMGIRRMVKRSGSWFPRVGKAWNLYRRASNSSRRSSVSASALDMPSCGDNGTDSDNGTGSDNNIGNREGPFRAESSKIGTVSDADVRGDDWRGSHEMALRAELPEGTELVLAHFRNCLMETPYCVVLDHHWQSVVITIRGSHSFEDFLVDAMAEPRSLEAAGRDWGFDGSGMYAHEGILQRAEWIRRDLEDSGVLRLLLGGCVSQSRKHGGASGARIFRDGGLGNSDRFDPEARMSPSVPLASAVEGSGFCAGYTLRIMGHSLGGGCAALLALLLKAAYPLVKALAVSPPGGLVSEGACREATEALVMSLVLNDDVVPRMSSQSIDSLIVKILEVLGRSRVSKLVVMRSLLRVDEDAHRPDQYLDLENFSWTDCSLEEGEGKDQLPVPPVTSTGGPHEFLEADRMESQHIEAEREGVSRYHRQLRRYRDHLRREYGSRRHLYRLRLPGRILRLVNTDSVVEQVDVRACDNGCVAFCCSCLAPPSRTGDVKACCCTPGRMYRKKRIFTPVWSSANDLAEIRIGPAFLVDHGPDEIIKALKQMLEDLVVSE